MAEDRNEGNGCRQLRVAIHGLIKDENVIEVDNHDDQDRSKVITLARQQFLDQVQNRADKHNWEPEQKQLIITCIPKLVQFDLSPKAVVVESTTVGHKGRKPITVQTWRIRSKNELPKIPVLVSLKPMFKERLGRELAKAQARSSQSTT